RLEDVAPVEQNLAFGTLARIEVVNAVEDPEQGRLAAAGRADERGDALVVERQVDVLEGLELFVEEPQPANLDLRDEIGRSPRLDQRRVLAGDGCPRHVVHLPKLPHAAKSRAAMLSTRMV